MRLSFPAATVLLLFQTSSLAAQGSATANPATPAASTLDFAFYRDHVEPLFLAKRPGNVRCVACHIRGAGTLRLEPLETNGFGWSEEASRKNFAAVQRFVVPGSPRASRLLRHPLAKEAGGDPFHGGGRHWGGEQSLEYRVLEAWVKGETAASNRKTAVRILQTNAGGDDTHVIDPTTNKVVGVIRDIEVPHGVTSAPDGSRVYITNESLHTVDVVDSRSLVVMRRIPLSGRPNNIAISKDGRRVYAGISEAQGAVDVIDTVAMARLKSVPVTGPVHNVYVTPDGKHAVAGSVASRVISVVDTATNELAWSLELDAGIRPMTMDAHPDGSTRNIYVQLSGFHGFAVVDFKMRKEIARIEHPPVPGVHAHKDGLQGAPAHGLGVSPDGKTLWSTSKVYGYAYVHSLPDLKEIGRVFAGQHPEWVTFTPDSKLVYIAAAGDNATFVVDVQRMKEVARIPVGQVPKRNGTAVMQVF
jgi:YVTN family beta-propeller protein